MSTRTKLSPNAEKALLVLYIGTVGWDAERSPDPEHALSTLAGITIDEARAAFRECEEHGFMEKKDSPRRGNG